MRIPKFVSKEAVVRIHDDQLSSFGGLPGLDENKLDSIVSTPQQTWDGEFLHPTIYLQAAAYLYHIAKGHAFIDGNKRTALAVTELFLRKNGYRFAMSKEDAYWLTMNLAGDADHQITKGEVADLIEKNCVQTQTVKPPPPSLEL